MPALLLKVEFESAPCPPGARNVAVRTSNHLDLLRYVEYPDRQEDG